MNHSLEIHLEWLHVEIVRRKMIFCHAAFIFTMLNEHKVMIP